MYVITDPVTGKQEIQYALASDQEANARIQAGLTAGSSGIISGSAGSAQAVDGGLKTDGGEPAPATDTQYGDGIDTGIYIVSRVDTLKPII